MTQSRTTYPEVGATRAPELPAGYAHLRLRHRLSERPCTVAEPGGRVVTRLGVGRVRLDEPCEIVWVEREEQRIGFGYGTLPGHVFVGEEAFVVERDAAGDVWFVVDVFSNPAVRWVSALRLFVPTFQRLYIAHHARAARGLLRDL